MITQKTAPPFLNRKNVIWFAKVLIPCTLAILINLFCIKIVFVNGNSMFPTINDKDVLVINQLGCSYTQGDIIVVNCKEKEIRDNYIVKRIIAAQGQHIEIDYSSNSVYIDGKKIFEDYINYNQLDPLEAVDEKEKISCDVPVGYVFVMGDNRNMSLDSRNEQIGLVAISDIIGNVITHIPTSKIFQFWGSSV